MNKDVKATIKIEQGCTRGTKANARLIKYNVSFMLNNNSDAT